MADPTSEAIVPRRGRRPASAKSGRNALLSAAIESFARNGYDGVSLRTIATDAKVDVALVSRLFGSKDGLWEAAVDHLVEEQAADASELEALTLLSETDPAAALAGFIRFFAALSYRMPLMPSFLLQEAATPGDRRDIIIARVVGPFHDHVRPIIEAAIRHGATGGTDPDVVLGMMIAAISLPLVSPPLFVGQQTATTQLRDAIADQAIAAFVRHGASGPTPPDVDKRQLNAAPAG